MHNFIIQMQESYRAEVNNWTT